MPGSATRTCTKGKAAVEDCAARGRSGPAVEPDPALDASAAITMDTVVAFAGRAETQERVAEILTLLDRDPYIDQVITGHRRALARFGRAWHWVDLRAMLYAHAYLARPRSYLEIGTRRGHSLAVVCAAVLDRARHERGAPAGESAVELNVVCCDPWEFNYAGVANPGPEFVRAQIARVGYSRSILFLSGRSQAVLPDYLRQGAAGQVEPPRGRSDTGQAEPRTGYPDAEPIDAPRPAQCAPSFELITVDGAHSRAGALADLELCLPRLAVGGMLVFDDISHPQHRYLAQVWREAIAGRTELETYVNARCGTGVAAAIRYRT